MFNLKCLLALVLLISLSIVVGCSKAISMYDEGTAFLEEANYDKAIESLEIALELEPDHREAYISVTEAYYRRGRDYADKGSYNLAIKDYERAIQLYTGKQPTIVPSDFSFPLADVHRDIASVHFERGRELAEYGHFQGALDNYYRALQLNPGLSEAYEYAAHAEYMEGRAYIPPKTRQFGTNYAIVYYQRAIEYDTNHFAARFHLSKIYSLQAAAVQFGAIGLGSYNHNREKARELFSNYTLISTSASELSGEYQSDESSARQKYEAEGTILRVNGVVQSVSKTTDGVPFIRFGFAVQGDFGVQAQFHGREQHLLASLTRGREVEAICTRTGYSSGDVILQGCTPLGGFNIE